MEEGKDWRSWRSPLLFLLIVTQVDAAHEPICNTSYGPGNTSFAVRVLLQLHLEEYDCQHSWNNATNFVLANGVGHDEKLVLSNTNTSLVLSACINVTYELNCVSGSGLDQTHYRIACVANCTDEAQNLKIPMSSTRDYFTTIGVAIGVGIGVGIIIIVIYLNKYSGRRHQPVQPEDSQPF